MISITNQSTIVIALCIGSLDAWSSHNRFSQRAQVRSSCCRRERDRQQRSIVRFFAADDVSSGEHYGNAQAEVQTSIEQSKEVVYGVSYIGGDPCGSKYNVDPFNDETNNDNKPGLPDDMRERIAALAAEKLARTKAEER